jgi:uracil phosphoribosyltransferase
MVFNLSDTPSIGNTFIAELRDQDIQRDRLRFRRNLERVGELLAYELSKTLDYAIRPVETPLGTAEVQLPQNELILATILRAGLPIHQGLLNYFDHSANAFVSAFRKNHKDGSFDVHVEYISSPRLEDKTLIVTDAMLATGASMTLAVKSLLEHGQPSALHIVTAIASTDGLNYLQRNFPDAHIWMGALDDELTAKSYIVPGLGDAGDLSYGEKTPD